MTKDRIDRIFQYIFIALFAFLLSGIPLAFTSYTRSVFEVNKMMVLRLFTLFTLLFWWARTLLYDANGITHEGDEKHVTVLGFKWRLIGLELPLLLWVGVNLLSTLFSQNVIISVIGAYDRWEGIFTIVNYIILFVIFSKLIETRLQLYSILAVIILTALFSSIYGIFQSLGLDFMNWSVDESKRVFACINNPVHFCAYVAMVVPLGFGWLLSLSTKEKPVAKIWKWLLFYSIVVIYYAQFLSFSRATWMGFVGSMTLFYMLVTNQFDLRSKRHFLQDFFATGLAIAIFYLAAIFRLHTVSWVMSAVILIVVLAYLLYSYLDAVRRKGSQLSTVSEWGWFLSVLVLVYVLFLFDLSQFGLGVEFVLSLLLSALYVGICFKATPWQKIFLSKLSIILIFTKLQYVAISLTSIMVYIVLLFCYYLLMIKENPSLQQEKKIWLTSFLIIFGAVIFVPTIPAHLATLTNIDTAKLRAINNVVGRTESYKRDAIQGTARTSMWKSSIPWIRDYWLIGSGPDTIKFMYPDYRRPEYGVLEGGHNFTPDRLHNEYLNTLATRGVFGFLIYYGGIILGWLFLVLSGFYTYRDEPMRYLAAGAMTGALIYLGQVLFNFGVVATLVLFYVLMGIALSVVNRPALMLGAPLGEQSND